MLIIHTSDLHLHAPMSAHLSGERAAERRRELLSTFKRLVDEAVIRSASAVLIAGDLFDTETVPDRVMKSVASIIESHPDIVFFYLPGNHEKETFLPICQDIPNLYVFGDTFKTYCLGDFVTVSGRSHVSASQWSELSLSPEKFNIVMLHGDVADKTAEHTVGLSDASVAGVRYLALGHYHFFREMPLANGGVAVYSGTPEGRGYDEAGEKGYVLIDTDKAAYTFVPFAKRRIFDLSLDVSEYDSDGEVLKATETLLKPVKCEDLVLLHLTGEHSMSFSPDGAFIETHLGGRYYSMEVRDESHLKIVPEEYRYDRSLKGEFIRTVLADDSLSAEMKEAVLQKGLSALTGGLS